ncbi:hypothetical protein VXE65_22690 [Mycolicibacterium conceptionense]|uniref:hypothetical protein n=1 Tax=Mycolicibacterium conceptionense TaxID=451644 RepID=UPI0032048C1A
MSATVSTPHPDPWLAVLLRRQPHQIIYNHGAPYLQRWYLIPRNPLCNIYLHRFVASDDPTCHDHPWWFASLILAGGYAEVQPRRITVRRPGSLAIRRARHRHSVRLPRTADGHEIPCLTPSSSPAPAYVTGASGARCATAATDSSPGGNSAPADAEKRETR